MKTQKVIFRAQRRKTPHVSAVLLDQTGSASAPLACWDSQSGHACGTLEWYYRTRPATADEYAPELAKLERIYAPEYKIEVCKKRK